MIAEIQGVVTKSRAVDGKSYITVEEGNSTINLSSKDIDLTRIPVMKLVNLQVEISGVVYAGKSGGFVQALQVTKLKQTGGEK